MKIGEDKVISSPLWGEDKGKGKRKNRNMKEITWIKNSEFINTSKGIILNFEL